MFDTCLKEFLSLHFPDEQVQYDDDDILVSH